MPVTLVESEIAAWLEALPACVAAGAKVYPFAAVPQDTTWPFVTYHRVHGSRVRGLKGPAGVARPELQVDVFDRRYLGASRLGAAIKEAVDGLSGTALPSGRPVQYAAVEGDADAYAVPPHGDEVAQYRATLPVTIWFLEG